MKTNLLLALFLLLFFTFGCTTAWSNFIEIKYIGKNKTSLGVNIGISEFIDKRGGLEKGYLGKRVLNSGSDEIYYVKGLNIASTITDAFKSYLEKSGYSLENIDYFQPDTTIFNKIDKDYKYVIAGDIKEFEFFASKNFVTTMVLDIKLIVYLANIEKGALTTIPVNLNLKRKDLKFSEKSIEIFINESLKEVILKAMTYDNLK
ncbi:MAG: hypothetical protein GY707_07205 [Desulfobacteraceae bacterium]|nr:hypothetical protein [Desulfobacteraceae bacterium]